VPTIGENLRGIALFHAAPFSQVVDLSDDTLLFLRERERDLPPENWST